jgi:hypothetical protein
MEKKSLKALSAELGEVKERLAITLEPNLAGERQAGIDDDIVTALEARAKLLKRGQ